MTITLDALVLNFRQPAAWYTANNPSVPAGAMYFETDTQKFKVNLGTAAALYATLPYALQGAKGEPGLSAFDWWKTLSGNGTKTSADFEATFEGPPGVDGASILLLVGTTIPVGGVPGNALFVRVSA